MRIAELMTQAVRTCRPGDSLEAAAIALWQHDCGCLPVVSADGSGRVVAMVTDRDVCMAALFAHAPLSELHVSDAMSREVRACNPEDDCWEAEAIMQEARLRRLPVVDGADRLLGLLSLADLARAAERSHGVVERLGVADTLAAVCRRDAGPTPPAPAQPRQAGAGTASGGGTVAGA